MKNTDGETALESVSWPGPGCTIAKQIWMYWGHDTLPPLMKQAIAQIAQDNPDYTLTQVNDRTLSHYLPDLRFNHPGLRAAHKSDLVRLALLQRYGGVWIDTAASLNQPVRELLAVNTASQFDLVGFYRTGSSDPFPVIEPWFLAAPAGNAFITRWLDAFQPIAHQGPDAWFAALQQRPDFPHLSAGIRPAEYQLILLAQQLALRDNAPRNLYLYPPQPATGLFQRQHTTQSRLSRLLSALTPASRPQA